MSSSSNQTKAYDFKTRDIKVLKKLLPYLLKMRARVIWSVSFLMLAKLANVGVPLALREIVDGLDQTNLVLVKSDGDLQFEGYISNYSNNPVAIQGNEQAALTRVTITVKVKFMNTKDEKQSFESKFSRFEDLPASEELAAKEEELLNAINEQLTQDIFNKAITNW